MQLLGLYLLKPNVNIELDQQKTAAEALIESQRNRTLPLIGNKLKIQYNKDRGKKLKICPMCEIFLFTMNINRLDVSIFLSESNW